MPQNEDDNACHDICVNFEISASDGRPFGFYNIYQLVKRKFFFFTSIHHFAETLCEYLEKSIIVDENILKVNGIIINNFSTVKDMVHYQESSIVYNKDIEKVTARQIHSIWLLILKKNILTILISAITGM